MSVPSPAGAKNQTRELLASSSLASSPKPAPFSLYLLSGAVAGLSVDCVLFPLDTIKTRMQSRGGLTQSGGFRKLFSGIASAAAGSAPTAALFFLTYETSKRHLTDIFHPNASPSSIASASSSSSTSVHPLVHCLSAGFGETVACLIRVPTENVKQKVQAGLYQSSWVCFKELLAARSVTTPPGGVTLNGGNGAIANFYRGFGSTILREIPFAFIQFPLYEFGKHRISTWRGRELDGFTCALIGSVCGGIAAAATCPLDVVKTRLMLQEAAIGGNHANTSSHRIGVLSTFRSVYSEGGLPRLFSGIVPRVLWISIGGGVFFGAYEMSKKTLEKMWKEDKL